MIASMFKHQILTWIGIIGSAIIVFGGVSVILDLADSKVAPDSSLSVFPPLLLLLLLLVYAIALGVQIAYLLYFLKE